MRATSTAKGGALVRHAELAECQRGMQQKAANTLASKGIERQVTAHRTNRVCDTDEPSRTLESDAVRLEADASTRRWFVSLVCPHFEEEIRLDRWNNGGWNPMPNNTARTTPAQNLARAARFCGGSHTRDASRAASSRTTPPSSRLESKNCPSLRAKASAIALKFIIEKIFEPWLHVRPVTRGETTVV